MTRAEAVQVVPTWMVDAACRSGELVRVLPEVYLDGRLTNGSRADLCGSRRGGNGTADRFSGLDPLLRWRVVAAYAAGRGALSHTTALALWGLRPASTGEPVHLSVPATRGMRSRTGLVVHQRHGFAVEPPQVVVRQGLPVTRLEAAIVDSWPLLPAEDRRLPVIRAVNERMTTPQRLMRALADAPKLPGRAELSRVLRLLDIGCRSPLEIWGHDHVFVGPGMPAFQRQVRIRIGRRTVYLDLYAERERVNIELDGAASHGDPRQREIDLRRDTLLAAAGIVVLRFSHRRLVHEPEAVRRETLAVLVARRAELGATA